MDRAAAKFPCHSQNLRITISNSTESALTPQLTVFYLSFCQAMVDRAAAEFPCHSQKLRITILDGTLWVEHLTAQPPGGWYPAELGGGEVQRFGLTCDSDKTCALDSLLLCCLDYAELAASRSWYVHHKPSPWLT